MRFIFLASIMLILGCQQVTSPKVKDAFVILAPTRVAIESTGNLLRLRTKLRITNLTDEALGLTYYGSRLATSEVSYRLTDKDKKEVSLLRREYLGSTLAATRVAVTLLQSWQSVDWQPEEVLVYPKVPEGHYWLVAHVEIDPPGLYPDIGLPYGKKGHRHSFDSKPLEISVEYLRP